MRCHFGNYNLKPTSIKFDLPPLALFLISCQCAEIIFNEFQNLFDRLPIGALVNGRILCVHGGIGAVESLDQVLALLDQLYSS